jgi:hypothetical protein
VTTTPPTQRRSASQVFAASATFAAGTLLLTCALLTLVLGISAIVSSHLIVIGPNYVYTLNTAGWGWVHIVLAILMAAIAFGLYFGSIWARVAAIVMASLSIVVMFVSLPYYPLWSIVVIALDVVVIWAVATWHTSQSKP